MRTTIITTNNKNNKLIYKVVRMSYIKCPVFNKNYETCKERWNYKSYTEEKQPTQNITQGTQMLDLVEKTLNQLLKNMFKELKNYSMTIMFHQIKDINKDLNLYIKKNKTKIWS